MEQAAADAIAELVEKDTWTQEDHKQLLGKLFEKHNAAEKFKEILGKLEAADPQPKGAAALKIGIARYMLCRFDGALSALADATDNKDRRYFQGMCLKCLAEYDKACEEFAQAVDAVTGSRVPLRNNTFSLTIPAGLYRAVFLTR